jgi:hypothetical protein
MMAATDDIVEGAIVQTKNRTQDAAAAMQDLAAEFFRPVANLQAGLGSTAVPAAGAAAPAQTNVHNEFYEGSITLATGEAVRVFFEEYLQGVIDDRQLAKVLG